MLLTIKLCLEVPSINQIVRTLSFKLSVTSHYALEANPAMEDTIKSKLLNDSGCDLPFEYVFVESIEQLLNAVEILAHHNSIAFDCEGIDLGRQGALTVASFLGIDPVRESDDKYDYKAYVIDVMLLGGDRVFSDKASSLRALLENPAIEKVTFDCRKDSDALFHQFGVTLRGVLELQVLDQAVRIHRGEDVPCRNPYITRGSIPFLKGMADVAKRYRVTNISAALKQTNSHKIYSGVWGKRPLSSSAIYFASSIVHLIKLLLGKMREAGELSEILKHAVVNHSARYESCFRDRELEVSMMKDKEFILEELAIVDSTLLPPRDQRTKDLNFYKKTIACQRWDKTVEKFEAFDSNRNELFNDVLFILQHDDWYSNAGMNQIRCLANDYPSFTRKQRLAIANPEPLRRYDDIESAYFDESGSSCSW